MPSLTLLAADPHLTPVRARPALAFGGPGAHVHQGRGGRLRLRRPLRRRRAAQADVAGTPSPTGGPGGPSAAAGPSTRRPQRPWLRRRGVSSPSPRGSSFGWRGAAAAASIAVIATGLGVLRVWPPLAVVMSGSMAPTINTGDMVVLMRLRSPAKIGDVVAVPVPDDARTRYGYPPVVIHRVFRITDGQIRTKGDARPAADPFTVPQTAVEAKVVADVPAGGRILSFFHSGPGLVWLLFGAALLFGFPLFDRLRDARGREAEATADLRDQLAAVTVSLAQLQAQQERSAQAADKALSQIDGLARLVADTLAHQPPAAGDAADAPDTSLPDVAELPGPAVEAARELHTESPTPPGPPAPSEPQVQPEPAAQAAPATEMNAAAQSRPTSPAETGLGRGPTEPLPAVQPALAPDFASVAQASCAARSAVSAAGVPNGLIRLSLPSPAPTCAAVTDASVAARPLGGDARFTSPAGVGRMSAPSRPALERWDALPTGSSVNGDGWAAPPAPVRSPRFQRPGRLIAASLAQPSPGA